VVGTVGRCVERSRFPDLSPDLFWRAETSSATADASVTPARMRSTAVLTIPAGASVRRAYLYWWGEVDDVAADPDVVLERPGIPPMTFTATRSDAVVQVNADAVQPTYAETLNYLSVTEVTEYVSFHGSGPYRVSGVGAHPLADNFNIAYAGWAIVVVYERASDPLRNVTLFDGLERVVGGTVAVALTDFRVPTSGFDGKLGIVGLDGELAGSQLRFGSGRLTAADALSNAQNPANNFFNGSRSYLGAAVTTAGDLPQTTGGPGSLGGTDFDVVDVTARLTAGQTSARAEVAAAANDGIQSMIWVLSITTIRPDLSDATKTVVDLNGGAVLDGDVLEYTVRASNIGNDDAIDTVLTDVLPAGLSYLPGSLSVTSSAATGPLTDALGDDAGGYDAAARAVTVSLGTGAASGRGGRLPPSAAATVRFRATVATGRAGGVVDNQAELAAAGASGAPRAAVRTDGDPTQRGAQPTRVVVQPTPEVDAGFADAAAEDAAEPVDAGFVDATSEDAAALEDAAPLADADPAPDTSPLPDAATSLDAAVTARDAALAVDAGEPVEDPGCGCATARRGPHTAAALEAASLAAACLGWARRRRRR
jgi:uncharacterized repeat protein (TIGR01451 family)